MPAPASSVGHGRSAVAGVDPGVLDLRAGVHDDREPSLLGAGRGLLVDDPELQPQRLDAESLPFGDRLVDDGTDALTVDEAVDDLDDGAVRDVGQGLVALAAVHAGGARVHRDETDPELALEPQRHAVGRAVGVVAEPDDGPGGGGVQQVPDDVRVVVVRTHPIILTRGCTPVPAGRVPTGSGRPWLDEGMRFGMFVPQGWRMVLVGIEPAQQWEVMVNLAKHADDGDVFESIWVYDHFHTVPQPSGEATHEAWTLMAAFAAATDRVRLGQMCTCMAYRNPAYLAKVAATVDVISGGRTEMGIGAGWYEHEWRAYGYGFPKAGD